MITLYHCVDARSFRPLWMLEEMQLPHELKVLPFPPRVHARDYLEINPLGTIPLFIDGTTRMTESVAICEYLAGRYGPTDLAVRADEPGYGAYLNALHFGEATLTFPQAIVLRYSRFEPPERRVAQAAEDYARWFLGRLKGVDAALARHAYIAGDRFTAADISVGYALKLATIVGFADRFSPATAEYLRTLQDRAAYRRAEQAQAQAARARGLPPAGFGDAATVRPTAGASA